ncbi:MAG: acetyltransferase [Chitinophagaceae bacterium]|nr:MAG: acetyltransferase [Chitinophagaceae bacterium]
MISFCRALKLCEPRKLISIIMIIIGYSGHAFVACSILQTAGNNLSAYCDNEEKQYNPFKLKYLGTESSPSAIAALSEMPAFIGIGNNLIRRKVHEALLSKAVQIADAIHPSSIICPTAALFSGNIMVGAGAIIQPLATIEEGVICNSGVIIEHECKVESFAHIGPGAILCGNVRVGANSFIGAGAVVRQGVVIGKNCMIGAGSVVVRDVPDNATVMGVPAR